MEVTLAEYERIDDLQLTLKNGKQLKIIQNPNGFCFGIDAVLLANFANIKPLSNVLDLCTGSGIIPLLLTAKTDAKNIVGIEIQKSVADMANRSVIMNDLQDKVEIICGDLKEYNGREFDSVICNPPYKEQNSGLISPNLSHAAAKAEIYCTLKDCILAAYKALKPSGTFFMVHRPERITDILCFMRESGVEPKIIQYVQPNINKPPTMVLIEGIKGAKKGVITKTPIYVYDSDGKYTEKILKIYSQNCK